MKNEVLERVPEAEMPPWQKSGQPVGEASGRGVAVLLEPAPLVDVLMEQVEYLVGHLSSACPPRCPDCARLERAMVYLLKPFR